MGLIYFNENDSFASKWLQTLFPSAVVDSRSIADADPVEILDYDRCHFFGGIGGWEYALNLAEWPTSRPVWTGSCPCQPFSIAGKGKGTSDERHLWPEFLRLISLGLPPTIFGEQVASPLGREWVAGVRADLEELGYAVGIADLCAAGVGAPHVRQRLWWVADRNGREAFSEAIHAGKSKSGGCGCGVADSKDKRIHGESGDAASTRRKGREGVEESYVRGGRMEFAESDGWVEWGAESSGGSTVERRGEYRGPVRLGDPNRTGPQGWSERSVEYSYQRSPWEASEFIACADGLSRRAPIAESGIRPLAHGIPGRVGKLRGYGNAIVPQVASEFIRAFLETEREGKGE